MKVLLVFLGVFTFVTQAHCYSVDDMLTNDFLPKKVSLKIENGSTKRISIEPVLEVSELLRGTTEKIQIEPGKTIEFDPSSFATKWGLEKVKVTGFTVSLEDGSLEELYVASKLNSKVRITDINLRKFFDRNN